jgi:hypothetical protein
VPEGPNWSCAVGLVLTAAHVCRLVLFGMLLGCHLYDTSRRGTAGADGVCRYSFVCVAILQPHALEVVHPVSDTYNVPCFGVLFLSGNLGGWVLCLLQQGGWSTTVVCLGHTCLLAPGSQWVQAVLVLS